MYLSTCLVEASLVGALLLPMVGKTKSTGSLGLVWTVPGNCRMGGFIGMHYFSQMRWPAVFFVFSQLSDHVHNHLVQSLYQPVSLEMVGHGLQLFDAKDLAHFLNYTTHKASTSITQEHDWGPRDRDVTSI